MATAEYPRERIERLIDAADRRIQQAFLAIVDSVRDERSLARIADLLEAGRVEEAVEQASRAMAERLATTTAGVFHLSAEGLSQFFVESVGVSIDFDRAHERAVRYLRNDRLRLIREVTDAQRDAIRQALVPGTEAGINPRQQARAFRNAIGLTARQEAAVANFRRLLEEGNAEALSRELRDRRFDRRLRRAIEGTGGFDPLTRDEIERMTERYRERYIKHRAEVIGRTEALRAVHAGTDELMKQAIDAGKIDPAQTVQVWHTRLDGRERETHHAMDGQERPIGQPFTSGAGVSIMYPGDPMAPGEETIQCRCAVTVRVRGVQPPKGQGG